MWLETNLLKMHPKRVQTLKNPQQWHKQTLRLYPERRSPERYKPDDDTIPNVVLPNEGMDFTEPPQADDPGYTLRERGSFVGRTTFGIAS